MMHAVRLLVRAVLATAAVALVAILPSSASGQPRPSECELLRAEVSAWQGTMRAEGYVFRMVSAGCPNPPYHLLPKP